MAGNFTFTSTGASILDFAYMQADTIDNEFLGIGSTATSADDFSAAILTRCERDILAQNPSLNRAEAVQAVSAGSRELVLPASMNGLDLDMVQLVRGDDFFNDMVLLEAPPQDGEDRVGGVVDGFRSGHPRYFYWSKDRSSLLLEYSLSQDTDFRLIFRAGPTSYTAATLASAVSRIPDQHIDALYLKVAEQLLRIMKKPEMTAEMGAQAMEAQMRLSDALTGPYWQRRAYRSKGYPESSFDHMTQSAHRGRREDSYSLVR